MLSSIIGPNPDTARFKYPIRAFNTAFPNIALWVNSFHEKAGMSQECFSLFIFSFLPVDSLHSSRAASVAILPSALLVERFSLGAWWAFPIQ